MKPKTLGHFNIISLPGLINIFFTYSFLGWVYERILQYMGRSSALNDILSFGPLKPYYGIIGVCVTLIFYYIILPKMRRSGILKAVALFIFISVFLSIILNFLSTMALDKALNIKLWDFSKGTKSNLMMYYNLISGVKYGLLGIFSLIFVYPGVTGLMLKMTRKIAIYQSIVLAIILIISTASMWIYRLAPYI